MGGTAGIPGPPIYKEENAKGLRASLPSSIRVLNIAGAMKYIRQTIIAGVTAIRSIYTSTGERTPGMKRKAHQNLTPEKVQAVNLRNAIKKLTAILNSNFSDGDYHVTLTYRTEPSSGEAADMLRRFKNNMRDRMKRRDLPWKWVIVTEYENERVHHHVVCNREALDVILDCWKAGHVHHIALHTDGNYSDLAEYLCKETEKTFRDPDAVARQRYDRSRNLVEPQPRNEQISRREYEEELRFPSEIEGYSIIEDTVSRYENELTREECLQCVMVSATPMKRYRKGRPAEYDPHYKPYEKQMQLDAFGYWEG